MKNSGYRMLCGWRVPAVVGLFLIPVVVIAGDSLLLKNGKVVPLKSIQWRDGAKDYQVESSEGDLKVNIAPKDIERLDIGKPAEFDKAQQLVAAGNEEAAIPLLEGVIEKYKMLLWDVRARDILGRAYLKKKNASKAIDTLQPLFVASPGPLPAPAGARRVYWEALSAAKRNDDLRKELDASIATGRRDDAATALVMRGNMLRAVGKNEDALQDYLKTVWFFEEVKDVQPEALFKAAEGLKEAGDARAEECRKALLQKYPDSEFAKKVAGKAE